jgi:hypothetical protein
MEDIFDQIKAALSNKLYYLALFNTVAIPDICCALQSENNQTDSKKYKNWFDSYITKLDPNKYGADGQLKAEHLWSIRCSLFHQGTTTDKKDYKRMLFIEPGNQTLGMHCTIVGANTEDKSLLIDIVKFCNDMITGAQLWSKENERNEFYMKNSTKLIQRYPEGVAPIFGVPVIG